MLNTLSLAGNRLRKLSGLEGLTGLKQLNIEGNRVRWVGYFGDHLDDQE
jgi:Leucine-rich repeat (LRR) protein